MRFLHRLAARRHRAGAEAGDLVEVYNLAYELEAAGQLDEAERWYRQALAGGDADAANNLAMAVGEARPPR